MNTYGGIDVDLHVLLTSAVVVNGQLHSPKTPPHTRYPLDWRLGGGGACSASARYEENILDPSGTTNLASRSLRPQLVANTDCAIAASIKGRVVTNSEDGRVRDYRSVRPKAARERLIARTALSAHETEAIPGRVRRWFCCKVSVVHGI
jgi:hypothetical protein